MPASWVGTPKTWTTGEVPTAAAFNTEFRDRLMLLKLLANDDGTPIFVTMKRLLSDFSITNVTALGDVGELNFDLGASETWAFFAALFYNYNATADLKLGMTVPSGATGRYGVMGSEAEVSVGAATIGTAIDYQGAGAEKAALVQGSIVNSTTAGTAQLQAAQLNAHASTNDIKAGSFLVAFKIG